MDHSLFEKVDHYISSLPGVEDEALKNATVQIEQEQLPIVCDNVVRKGKVPDTDSKDPAVQRVQRLHTFLSGCTELTATILQTIGVKGYDGMVIAVVNRI